MSDSKKIPELPPDDFSKTTPNINLPADSGHADWDKTNYNFPRQPTPDDWGKTITNIKPIDTGNPPDYGETVHPGTQKPKAADWGVTQANVNAPNAELGSGAEEFEPRDDKTTPYFRLPEAERAKYQSLPPTPAERAAREEGEKKGKIPGWAWVAAGLAAMLLFMFVVLAVAGFLLFMRGSSFEASVKGAPPGSSVLVDDIPWGVTSDDGSIKLNTLKAGRRVIKISHPSFTCEPREITGSSGTAPEPIIARCQAVAVKPTDDCGNIRLGEFDKAERCYNAALDALPDPFTAEDLVRALNILIINFDSGKSDVPPIRLAALQKGGGFIKKLPPGVVLEIGGHTDNVGSDASNQTLSEARASAVKSVLVKFGVADSALQIRGYGASKPKPGADNATEQGRFYNRRIEYSVVRK